MTDGYNVYMTFLGTTVCRMSMAIVIRYGLYCAVASYLSAVIILNELM